MESSGLFITKRRLNFGILVKLDSAFPDAYCHFKIFDRLEKGPIGTMPQQKAQFQLELCHNRRAPFQLELCHNRRHHFNWNYATTGVTISIGTIPQQKSPFQLELCHNRRHHFNWNCATAESAISIETMPQQKAPFQLELCHNRKRHFNWNYATAEGTISGKIQVLTCIVAIRKWS